MKLFLLLVSALLGASSTSFPIQNPCTTATCACDAGMEYASSPVLDGGWKTLPQVGNTNLTAEFRFFPKINGDEDDSLHDGVCSKPLEGCECIADPCGFDFSFEIKITSWGTATGTPKVGLGDPGTGTPFTATLIYNATTGSYEYSSGFLNREVVCGNPSVSMKLVLGNGTDVWGRATIDLQCPDCTGS
jgi:hypothetical protein